MEITEVRIKLMEDSDDRLQAFCSITFDNAFVVRDLKIIDGTNGPFVAMPSRKLTSHCPNCGYKNHLRAHFCNQCGSRLKEERTLRDAEGRVKLYADIAHPINAACREQIQTRVIAEFHAEVERALEPGYVSRYDEDYDLDFEEEGDGPGEENRSSRSPPPSDSARSAHRSATPPPPHFTSSSRQAGMPPLVAAADASSVNPVEVAAQPAGPSMTAPVVLPTMAPAGTIPAATVPAATVPPPTAPTSRTPSTNPRRGVRFGEGIFDPPTGG